MENKKNEMSISFLTELLEKLNYTLADYRQKLVFLKSNIKNTEEQIKDLETSIQILKR